MFDNQKNTVYDDTISDCSISSYSKITELKKKQSFSLPFSSRIVNSNRNEPVSNYPLPIFHDFSKFSVSSFTSPVLQPKLKNRKPYDKYEHEVQVRSGSSAAISRVAPGVVRSVLNESGRPLSENLRSDMEQRLGHDFSKVRIHNTSRAVTSARAVGAEAYTVGQHIVFGENRFQPDSHEGRRLLTHELVHTLQQPAVFDVPASLMVGKTGSIQEREAEMYSYRGLTDHTGENLELVPEVRVARRLSSPILQRRCPPTKKKRGWAGGCGVCLGSPRAAGTLVHQLVQYAFFSMYPSMMPFESTVSGSGRMEKPVPVVPEEEETPFVPELDLSRELKESGLNIIEIGEIKPFDDAGQQKGEAKRDLEGYRRELENSYNIVRMLRLPPPTGIPLVEPVYPQGCPRQKIHVCLIEPGIYQYFCEPPWSELPKSRCNRSRCGSEPEGERYRVPELVRNLALAAATVAILREAAKRLPKQVGKRALAYAQVAALIAVVTLMPENVEAKMGSGQSPLEALFAALESEGIPVPDDLRQRIESNPELKAALEKGARTGDMSEAQKVASEQMMRVIAENPDAFSEEDLIVLAGAMEQTGGETPEVKPTVEALHKAIEARKRGKPISEAVEEYSGDGAPSEEPSTQRAESDETAEAGPDAEGEQTQKRSETQRYPHLSEENRQRLNNNPELKRLFDAMTGRQGRGPEVDDEVVSQFLETVPQDLRAEEANRLIDELQLVTGESLETIMQQLEEAVKRIRRPAEGEEEIVNAEELEEEQSQPETTPSAGKQSEAEIPESEAVRQIREFLQQEPQPGRFAAPAADKREKGMVFHRLMARSKEDRLLGAQIRFVLEERIRSNEWKVTLYPGRWYNAGGEFVEQWPGRPVETVLTIMSTNP